MEADSVKHLLDKPVESSGVPVEHMDYEYITKSSDVKELEKVLKALRSGKEGFYPDLIRHCEERIRTLNPKSKALRKDKRPATEFDVGKEEWQRLNSDIKDFVDQAHLADQSMKEEGEMDDKENIPVRGSVTIDTSGQKSATSSEPDFKPSGDRIRSHDYRSWEKYNADKEAERVEESDETKATRRQAQQLNSSRSAGIQEKLKTEGYSPKELEMLANREKDKGNEAFRAGDYSEAIVYYSRSLSVIPSAPAYNNRALARIRLEQFASAVGDCNKVLEIESDNLKALLRRGTARKSLKQYKEACKDLEYVLSVEPGNKQAKDLLKDVKKKMAAENSKPSPTVQNGLSNGPPSGGKRMVIEEVEGSDSSDSEADEADGNISSRRKTPEGKEKASQRTNSPSNSSTGGAEVLKGKTADQPATSSSGAAKNGTPSASNSPAPSSRGQAEGSHSTSPEQGKNPPSEEKKPVAPAKPLPEKAVKLQEEGTRLYKAGQYGHAKEKYEMALSILEKDVPSYQSVIVSLYSNRAACHLKLGDCQGCISDCNKVLETSPYNIKVYLRRGSAYETLERYKLAYVDFHQAMTLDPYNQSAQVGASRVQKVLYQHYGPSWRQELPAHSLLMAPLPQQSQPTPAVNLTGTQLKVGDPTEKRPDGPEVGNGSEAGHAQKQEKSRTPESDVKSSPEKNRKEEELPKKKISPEENFQKLKAEGNDFVKKGKFVDAIRCYTSCIEIDPSQAVPFTNRALCHLKLQQYKEAEQDCTVALELDPKNVKGFYRRGLARKNLENYFDSIKDLTALLKLEPTNSSAKKELETVKDFWRKDLKEKHQTPPGQPSSQPAAPETSKKKNILIEDAESDSEEEKDDKQSNASSTGKPSGKKMPSSSSNGKEKDGKEEKHGKHQNSRTDSKQSDKHKTSRSKSKKEDKESRNSKAAQSTHSPKLNKVTAYEFMQAWMSVKSKNSQPYAKLLQQVPPEQLPTVLSNKLDAPMLTKILKAVEDHLVKSDPERSYRLLSNLRKAQRFQTVLLFMTNEQKQGIDKCLASLSANESQFCSKEDVEKLRKSFGLIS